MQSQITNLQAIVQNQKSHKVSSLMKTGLRNMYRKHATDAGHSPISLTNEEVKSIMPSNVLLSLYNNQGSKIPKDETIETSGNDM
jgi:hypothetical protein